MAHPQGTPRGLHAQQRLDLHDGTNTHNLTVNSTAVIFSGGIQISAAQTLTGNSTAIIHGAPESAIPTTDNGVAWTMVSNSTGVAVVVNTTGTTWKYLNVTTLQPS